MIAQALCSSPLKQDIFQCPVCHMTHGVYNTRQGAVWAPSAVVHLGHMFSRLYLPWAAFFRLEGLAHNGPKTTSVPCCFSVINKHSLSKFLGVFCLGGSNKYVTSSRWIYTVAKDVVGSSIQIHVSGS
jgi:hypothetical protein